MEDVNLWVMGGCLSLGKNLHDNGFGLFRDMLAYKLWKKGSCLVRNLPDIFERSHGKSGRSKEPAESCEREKTKEKGGRKT
ncbi:hypothetical protein [Dorea sp.]|uniref:hypothetical protein n=1 Tax=Dorea sp. TaxID=2040332 RepID=UPI0035284E72